MADETVTWLASSEKAFPQVSPYSQSKIHPAIGVKVKKSVQEKLTPEPALTYECEMGLVYDMGTKLGSQSRAFCVIEN